MSDLDSLGYPYSVIQFSVSNGASVVATGPLPGRKLTPFGYTIVGWIMTSDLSTTANFDVWALPDSSVSRTGAWPTVTNSICDTTKPSLTAQIKNESIVGSGAAYPLSGWTTYLPPKTWLIANVDANNNGKALDLFLLVKRT